MELGLRLGMELRLGLGLKLRLGLGFALVIRVLGFLENLSGTWGEFGG